MQNANYFHWKNFLQKFQHFQQSSHVVPAEHVCHTTVIQLYINLIPFYFLSTCSFRLLSLRAKALCCALADLFSKFSLKYLNNSCAKKMAEFTSFVGDILTHILIFDVF